MRRPPGSGSVRKRGPGRYQLRFIAAGKPRSVMVDAKDDDDARHQMDALATRLSETPAAAPGGYTVRTWLAEWLRRNAKSRSWKPYSQRVRCYLDTAPFADELLVNLRARDVWGLVRSMLDAGHSASTVRATLAHLRTACTEAQRDELIRENPCRDVKLPRKAKAERVRAPLTLAAVERVFASGLDAVDGAIFAAGVVGGLRAGELFAMPLRNVRAEGDVVMLHVAFGGFGGAPTKGGEARDVPVIGVGATWLARWLEIVPRDRARNPEGLLFPGRFGGRRNLSHASRWLRARLLAAGLPTGHRFHDLRHTAAAGWLNGWWGVQLPPEHVQAIMGHASVSQTEAYTGTAREAMLAAVAAAANGRRMAGAPESSSGNGVRAAENGEPMQKTACSSEGSGDSRGYDAPGQSSSIREATAVLLRSLAGGRATAADVEAWRALVLAEMPEPWRSVVALPDGPFRVRRAVDAAEAVLRWMSTPARTLRKRSR